MVRIIPKTTLLLMGVMLLAIVPYTQYAFATAPTYQAVVTDTTSIEGVTSCTMDVNVQASTDLIVVGFVSDVAINTISDEDGQTYTQRASWTTSHFSYLYTTTSPTTNAANTITITTSSSADMRCFAITYAGVDTSSPIGNTGSNGGASSPTSDTITYSTGTNDSDIVHVCGNEWSDTETFDTGKTIRSSISDGGANKFSGAIATETTTTAGSNNATCGGMTTGKAWSHVVVEVKGVSSPIYVVDLLDVYESASTTLDSGTAVCLNVDLKTADDCNGLQTYSFVDFKSISAQDVSATGTHWSTDGTKLFIAGYFDVDVNEYTCTAWDVSTCSFVDSKSVTSNLTGLFGLTFSTDGKKMFLAGVDSDDVNEYICTSAWDVSTCSFVDDLSITTNSPSPRGVSFSTDGTKMYLHDYTNIQIDEYACQPFDVSTCTYTDNLTISEDTQPLFSTFTNDGKTLYVSGETGDEIDEYTCTAWDVSTCSFVGVISISAQTVSPRGISISPDNTKLFLVELGAASGINEYTLSSPLKTGVTYRFEIEVDNTGGAAGSPNDVTLASVVGSGEMFGTITATDITSSGCGTNTDWTDSITGGTAIQLDAGTTCSIAGGGTQEYWFIVTIAGDAGDNTATFDVSDGTVSDVSTTTSFDVTTPVFAFQELDVYESASTTLDSGTALCANTAFYDGYCTGWNPETFVYASSDLALTSASAVSDLVWNGDGSKLFTTNFSSSNVSEYSCSTNYDASTCSFTDNTSFSADETEIRGITWNGDGTKLYITGSIGDDINEYNCTAYDVSTCTTASSVLSVAAQEGTPQAIHWNNDGTKFFMLGFDGLDVNEYGSCTAYDVSTCSFVDSYSVNQDTLVAGLDFSPDGTRMFVSGRTSDEVNEYRCKAWDVSTCSFVQTVSITATSASPQGITISSDGTKMFIADDTGDDILEYDLNAFDVGSTYRFEIDVANIGGVTTSPDVFSMLSSVGATQSLGSITATDITSSGCSTNTNWTDSIVATTNVQLDAGTTCSLAPGSSTTYWFIVTVDDTAPRTDTSTFKVDDGTFSNTSSAVTFSVRANAGNFTKAISDVMSLTDNQFLTILHNKSDPMSITDSVTTSHGRTSSKSDPISITDSVSTVITRFDAESDPLSITDSVTETIMRFDSESDPLSVTDSVSTLVMRFDTESDPISITDSISATVIILNTESDPLSITDSVSTIVTWNDAESDPISITDSITTSASRSDTESDPLSITDSVSTIVTRTDSESDPLSITDSVTSHITHFESDPLSITDSVTPICTGCGDYTDTESDPLSITDSVSAFIVRYDAESDPLSITDSITRTVTRNDAESDPLSITDSVATLLTKFDAESDPLSITDSFVDTVARFKNPSDPLSLTDIINATCTGCGTNLDTESDPLSITDSMTPLIVRNISFVEGVDVGDDGAGNPDVQADRFDTESDPLSITDSLLTVVSRFFTNVDQLSIIDSITATNSSGIHYINVTESVNVSDLQNTALFFYEPTGKVIWFKVSDPTNSTKGGVYSYMCDSTEIVTGVNGTGYVKCTTLHAPTTTTRGGVYEQACPGGQYVSGIDSNGDLICTALP